MSSYKIVVDCSTGEASKIELTADEIAAMEANAAKAAEERAAQEAAAEKTAADKESGNQKLKDLGLTDEEIAAVITYERRSWGNDNQEKYGKYAGSIVTPQMVADMRVELGLKESA